MTFRPTWISWCNKSHFEMLETSLERIFYSDSCHWICSLVIKKSTGWRLLVTEIMDHTNSFFLEKFLCVQSNRFLISSFTKWTHNRPHSNITEDRMGKIMNFQENAVMASKLLEAILLVILVILLMTAAFWTRFLFESLRVLTTDCMTNCWNKELRTKQPAGCRQANN